jgi:IS30 family transposase
VTVRAATGRRRRTHSPMTARAAPKPAKLATSQALRQIVQDDLRRRFSPEQIAGRLRRRFPENPELWMSTETIYQSLYVQSRGALRRELTRSLDFARMMALPVVGRQRWEAERVVLTLGNDVPALHRAQARGAVFLAPARAPRGTCLSDW